MHSQHSLIVSKEHKVTHRSEADGSIDYIAVHLLTFPYFLLLPKEQQAEPNLWKEKFRNMNLDAAVVQGRQQMLKETEIISDAVNCCTVPEQLKLHKRK